MITVHNKIPAFELAIEVHSAAQITCQEYIYHNQHMDNKWKFLFRNSADDRQNRRNECSCCHLHIIRAVLSGWISL